MLVSVLLAAACLDLPGTPDNAYSVRLTDVAWSCGEPEDLAAAERARLRGGDLIWFRVDRKAWLLREPADLAEAAALLRPLRERTALREGLRQKQAEYAAEAERLEADRPRLVEERGRYAPGTEKYKVLAEELQRVDDRLGVVAERRAAMAAEASRWDDEHRELVDDVSLRLGGLVERALRQRTARPSAD